MSRTETCKKHHTLRLKEQNLPGRDTEREQPEREKEPSTEAEKRMFLIFFMPDTW